MLSICKVFLRCQPRLCSLWTLFGWHGWTWKTLWMLPELRIHHMVYEWDNTGKVGWFTVACVGSDRLWNVSIGSVQQTAGSWAFWSPDALEWKDRFTLKMSSAWDTRFIICSRQNSYVFVAFVVVLLPTLCRLTSIAFCSWQFWEARRKLRRSSKQDSVLGTESKQWQSNYYLLSRSAHNSVPYKVLCIIERIQDEAHHHRHPCQLCRCIRPYCQEGLFHNSQSFWERNWIPATTWILCELSPQPLLHW